jgi:hypothetical protein
LLGSSLTEKNSILFSATTKLCITVTKAVRPFNGSLTVSPALSAYVDEEPLTRYIARSHTDSLRHCENFMLDLTTIWQLCLVVRRHHCGMFQRAFLPFWDLAFGSHAIVRALHLKDRALMGMEFVRMCVGLSVHM